jgi:hypothetical protein
MNREPEISAEQSGPVTSAGAWGLRNSGLVMGEGNMNEVDEIAGMWPLKPDADLVALTKALAPGGWINPPGESFAHMMTQLGLIRTARWFVVRTQDFNGYTLVFVSQFDGTLEKYFDDFILNGKDNLTAVSGHCVGRPTGENVTARDVVDYIAAAKGRRCRCRVPSARSCSTFRPSSGSRGVNISLSRASRRLPVSSTSGSDSEREHLFHPAPDVDGARSNMAQWHPSRM